MRHCAVMSIQIKWIERSGAGWSSLAARRAHNPKVVGSNPAPATKLSGLRWAIRPPGLGVVISEDDLSNLPATRFQDYRRSQSSFPPATSWERYFQLNNASLRPSECQPGRHAGRWHILFHSLCTSAQSCRSDWAEDRPYRQGSIPIPSRCEVNDLFPEARDQIRVQQNWRLLDILCQLLDSFRRCDLGSRRLLEPDVLPDWRKYLMKQEHINHDFRHFLKFWNVNPGKDFPNVVWINGFFRCSCLLLGRIRI